MIFQRNIPYTCQYVFMCIVCVVYVDDSFIDFVAKSELDKRLVLFPPTALLHLSKCVKIFNNTIIINNNKNNNELKCLTSLYSCGFFNNNSVAKL